LFVMPTWFIFEPLKRAPLATGVTATLDPAPTWQFSQTALVGKWLTGLPTMAKPMAGIAKPAAASPWHCWQLVEVLGALAWISLKVGNAAKSLPDLWQELHCAVAANGMWLAGLSWPLK
jgi:hypothetical protein